MRYKANNNPSKELAEHFASFIANSQGHRSPHTIDGYKIAMRLFADYADERKRASASTFGIEFFTEENGEAFKSWLKEKGIGKKTINQRLSQLTAFLKFHKKDPIYASHYFLFREISRFTTPQRPNADPLVLSREAIKAIIGAVNLTKETGFRYSLMIHLLYETAARIDELLSIRIRDLHLYESRPYVTLMGKGRKIRKMPLVRTVLSKLKRYIVSEHGNDPEPDDYLFYSKMKGKGEKSSSRGFNKQLDVIRQVAQKKCPEVPDHIHAHDFRHARATHWLEDGMNIFQVSKLLGHESVKTTMIYLSYTDKMKEEALRSVEKSSIKDIKAKWKESGALRDLF